MEAVGEEEGTVVADGREEARDVHEEEAFESASSFSKTKMSSAGLLCRLLVSCGGCSCSCGCGCGCCGSGGGAAVCSAPLRLRDVARAGENGSGVSVAAASTAGDRDGVPRGGVPVGLAAEGELPANARSPLMRTARSICCLRLIAQSCAATELRFARFASLAS
jgi:hypothetical protein